MTPAEAVADITAKIKTIRGDTEIDEVVLSIYVEKLVNDVLDYCHRHDFPRALTFTCMDLINKRIGDEQTAAEGAAHLGFAVVIRIISQILTSHKASITQYVNANHNFWNLGAAENTYWDGVWTFDGSIDWSGIKPDADYKERQSHAIDILTKVNSAYAFKTGQSADITYKITSKHRLLTSHKAGSIYYVDIDLDLKKNIENRALNTGKTNATQSRTTGNAKNLWDGSFCWDGSHAWEGDYTLQNAQMENLCTFYNTDKNGNIKKGTFERL